jgi:hypothetical protein
MKDPMTIPTNKESTIKIRERFSTTTIAMFDALTSNSQLTIGDVLTQGIEALLSTDYQKALVAGRRARHSTTATTAQYALSGARALARTYLLIAHRGGHIELTGRSDSDVVSLTPEFRRQWKVARARAERKVVKEPITVQAFGEVSYYGGMSEWQGWAHAPLRAYDVLHVRPFQTIDSSTWETAFPGWIIKESPDGQISLYAPVGSPIKEVVTTWMDEQGIFHEGIREAKNNRRRELNDLPPRFLADIITKMTPLSRGLIKGRHGSSINKLFDDTDDIHSHITIWILELAQSFDAQLGNPFGTWVTQQLPRKLYDLNRTLHGRTASDAEMFYARAVSNYQITYGRNPSMKELSEHLDIPIEQLKQQKSHVEGINNLRNATPLIREDSSGDDETLQIADMGMSPGEFAELGERAHQVTMAILTATGSGPSESHGAVLRKPLGFLVTYLLNYDDWVKGDLIHLAGCRDRKVSEEVTSVNKSLARNLSAYRQSNEDA